ncbi:hypothetical protein CEXT_605661 [Caerostris extrusa]|uniref:Uncharacterized protein n=1 Tax=Caerostris extrusa TaxID=172846 RepID=A0AAV4Y390_CAEEX|nr:hypothetical protein CEXT_605661 [Caerostris extrusa]
MVLPEDRLPRRRRVACKVCRIHSWCSQGSSSAWIKSSDHWGGRAYTCRWEARCRGHLGCPPAQKSHLIRLEYSSKTPMADNWFIYIKINQLS